jgi:23S rRNA A1618 N6-methylase RlmF
MHKIDLIFLSTKWPKLNKYIKKNRINAMEKEAQMELQKAIAFAYYNIILLTTPENLVPMVNNRIQYLKFIQNIIEPGIILDIGTGSSCVYPLLGCRIFKKSKWIGTEIDDKSIAIAEIAVKRNLLQDRITIIKGNHGEFFTEKVLNVDFVMTNPPFYSSKEELKQGFLFKESCPLTVGVDQELYTLGGEFEFVKGIIQEGLEKKLEMWMSSLVGKKENFLQILKVRKTTPLFRSFRLCCY